MEHHWSILKGSSKLMMLLLGSKQTSSAEHSTILLNEHRQNGAFPDCRVIIGDICTEETGQKQIGGINKREGIIDFYK